MDAGMVKCAFCGGTGKDPFNLLSEVSVCQVCLGKREWESSVPVIACAFCKGSGVYPGKRVTCTVCFGKGAVSENPTKMVKCPVCKGTGAAPDSGLPCLKCKGRGLVSK